MGVARRGLRVLPWKCDSAEDEEGLWFHSWPVSSDGAHIVVSDPEVVWRGADGHSEGGGRDESKELEVACLPLFNVPSHAFDDR